MRAYHFCAECSLSPGVSHVFDGVITSDLSPFAHNFHYLIRGSIAAAMKPSRDPGRLVLRSLSLLGEEK